MSKKKTGLLVFALVAIVSISIIGTFARYRSTGAGTGSATIAKWAVTVNGTSIAASTENTFSAPITWNAAGEGLVASDHVAPGMTGTASLVIDTAGSEVAANYWISIDASELANDQITVSGVRVGGEELALVPAGTCEGGVGATEAECTGTWEANEHAGEYAGSIALNGAAQTATVTVTWADANTEVANAADTEMGIAATDVAKDIPISITVEQKVN